MKVLVIPSWYPNGTDKLMGIYHKEYCEALSKRGIDVDMFYIDRQRLNAPFKYLGMQKQEVKKENGYNVYIKKMLDVHKINANLQLKRYTKCLEKLYLEYIKEKGVPDILHAEVTIPAGYAVCKLGEKYHIPVVVSEHASYFKRFFTGKNQRIGEYVLKTSKFTTVSNYMAKEIKEMGYEATVIPNLVDTEAFKKPREEVKGLKLVTVSALRQGKRIDDLILALKYLREEKYDATLTIIGDGFLEDYYKKKCQELEMDKYVDFVGRKSKEEIAEILTKHNIFVMASEAETFFIPGVEALASGMPIVATKCLGPEEYITKECGVLVPVGDIKAIKKAIKEVYQNIHKYDRETLRKIADKYSSKNVTDIAIKIYEDLLKKK